MHTHIHTHTHTQTQNVSPRFTYGQLAVGYATKRIHKPCLSRCPHVQGYNDNSGLGPILANYLNQSDPGQILALVINELGDHQMETYFRSTDDSYGGMICRDEPDMDDLFNTMHGIHRKSFKDLGGKYIPRDENEKTCAIRLPPNRFFEVLLVVSVVVVLSQW